jgi:glycosyltransferase involved in cell wall biosynthesis
VEYGKGAGELFDFFTTYKRRNPGPLALVFLGRVVKEVGEHPDVFRTGFVDDDVRRDAVAGCMALVQPSFFESFSMVLTEAWAAGKPALVQGYCDVLTGQARRSRGAIPYRGYAEFEAALDRLVADPGLAAALGRAGRRYVETHYSWDTVLDRYEGLLERVVAGAPTGPELAEGGR